MVKAVWNSVTVADSDETIVIENNHYFPPEAVNREMLRESSTTSICPWKGTAHYYGIEAAGQTNQDAAWYYPEPKAAAAEIKGRIAFWKGVVVT